MLFIDAHSTLLSVTTNPNSAYQGCFSYMGNLFDKLVYNSFLKRVSIFAQSKWPTIFSRKQYIGFCGYSVSATCTKDALFNVGIPHSFTLEVNDNAGNLGRGNEQPIVLSTNQIFNIIRSVICNCRYLI